MYSPALPISGPVRDLNRPKESAELLGSRLQHNNLLAPNTTYSWCRRREKGLVQYFSMEETFAYCHNVAGFFQAMGYAYDPTERRLFIDSCKPSLKCVLLHNGNLDMLQYQLATPFILRKLTKV